MNASGLLDALRTAGVIDDLDAAFARLMVRLAGASASSELALAAALVSQHVAAGDVCCVLSDEAGRLLAPGLPPAPPVGPWIAALRASPVVAGADDPAPEFPLVLDDAGRLYLQRYWRYERLVAGDLLQRAVDRPQDVDESRLARDLARVFPPRGHEPDWQRVAAATAVLRRLCVISGGPGTGKTFTVTAVLALLAAQSLAARRPLRAALVAPTGKAAARMQEAVRQAEEHLAGALGHEVVAALPATASTIHRLLDLRPDGRHGRSGDGEAMPLDVLVVDEASMADLGLVAKLVARLSPETRLVLVGDRHQLASVEAGAVLGDVCGPASGPSPAFAATLSSVVGHAVPAGPGPAAPLADAVVVLRHSRRFGESSGIGRLAAVVNAGDVEGARRVLGSSQDVAWLPATTPAAMRSRLAQVAVDGFGPYLAAVRAWHPRAKEDAQVASIFAALARFRVLCAHRHGPAGSERLSEHVQAALAGRGLLPAAALWYPGRPVLITQNDYALGVFNGDIGVALPDADGRLRVAFQGTNAGVRMVSPARLPAHESVWATTVHRAQGSEFDEVLVVLPPEPSRVVTRELLYTAITRARRRVEIWGPAAVVEAAVRTPLERSSGLRDALWGARRASMLPSGEVVD